MFSSQMELLAALCCSAVLSLQGANAFSRVAPLTNPITSPEEVAIRQAKAEEYARSKHDNFAMNALFVNIDEKPKPTVCAISPESKSRSLPSDLPPGCLLRIGPNGAAEDEGFLDGDGMIHCITIPDAKEPNSGILYSATYVETKGRTLEQAGKNSKYRGTLGAAPQGLPMLLSLLQNGLEFGTLDVQKDTCNTALAVSGNRVLALMEQSPPTEIEVTKDGRVQTVESFARLNGTVPVEPINGGSMGAHGRTDPTTQERVHVSYNSVAPPYLRIDTFAEGWKLTSSIGIDVPAPVMVHDSVLTEHYIVILDFPLTIRPRRFLQNKFPVEYEAAHGARIGLSPRSADKDETTWFDVESGVVLHAANAYEREDGKVVVHGFKSMPKRGKSYILDYTPSFLYEWILDPRTGKTVSERCLNQDVLVEFPNTDDNMTGRKTDATYALVTTAIGEPLLQFKTPQSGVLLDAVAKLALEDNEQNGIAAGDVLGRFDLPPGWHMVSEPTVVNKIGGTGHYVLLIATKVTPADGDEDHVKVATDGKSMKSQLLVLDGDQLSDGPITTVDLPYHVNYGLHSLFLDWNKMK